jgi:CheY-like chemotaxis protein
MNHVLIVDDEAEIRDSLESSSARRATSSPPRRPRRGPHPARRRGLRRRPARHLAARPRRPRDPRRHPPDGVRALPEVIIISGHGTIEAAVRATKLGAYDFLEKPLSLDRTLIVLKNAINARQLREDNQEFVRQLALPLRRHRQQRAHEGAAPADQAHGPHQRPRPDLWRIRHRQGAHRPRHARGEPAQGPRLRRAQLRRHPRGPHRDGTLRLPPRRHARRPPQRRAARKARDLRARRRRHALPRRGRRHEPQDPGEGAARARRAALPPRRRHPPRPRRCARHRRHQQGPRRGDRARQLPRRPLLPPQRHPVLRAAAARPQGGHPSAGEGIPAGVRRAVRPPSRRDDPDALDALRPITGRATCASCAIWWSAC